jgi:hypothetical protein
MGRQARAKRAPGGKGGAQFRPRPAMRRGTQRMLGMETIRAYRMKGQGMEMADMGYVIIDKPGRLRARQIDRRFGAHVGAMVQALRQAKPPT